jgi:two-component system response regulator BaeR
MNQRVLIVEDDEAIASLLADYLHASGFTPELCADGALALAQFQQGAPCAAVLLDLNLPGLDGLQVCQQLRQHSNVPILMVTARVEELDRILGLEMGADDYLCKPFSPREVVARVRALVRRAQGRLATPSVQQLQGGFQLDDAGQRIGHDGHWLNLTPVEFRLLKSLLLSAGRVLSRQHLLDSLHDDFRDVSDRVVDSHIKNLRRKLAQLPVPQDGRLQAVDGVGYRWA